MILEEVIARTLLWARPSDGDNLTGFWMDADHAFESTEVFETVRIQRTEDPTRLLVVTLIAHENVATLHTIAAALREAWHRLVYLAFEASAIEFHGDHVRMRFVTATGDGSLCVTGEVTAWLPLANGG